MNERKLSETTPPSRRFVILYRLLTRVSLHGFRKYVPSVSFLQNIVLAGCDAVQSDKVHAVTSQKTAVLLREPPMCAIIFSVNFINASSKQNITLLVHHRSSLVEKLLFSGTWLIQNTTRLLSSKLLCHSWRHSPLDFT